MQWHVDDRPPNGFLEYVCRQSPVVCGRELLDSFLPILPKEAECLTESEAISVMESDLQRLLEDEALLSEIKQDCSLENLYIEGEHRTLDEVLQVIPPRTQRSGRLHTLEALPESPLDKVSGTHALSVRARLRRPQVDQSYLNSPDGFFDSGRPIQDAIFTVFIYRPLTTTVDCSNSPWKLIVDQRIEILGSQSLSTLRDTIRCPQDMIWLGDCSEALDKPELHIPASLMYTSAYFFIENVFYDDLRNPKSTALSADVIDWHNSKLNVSDKNHFTAADTGTLLGDLKLHLGKPYLYLHQGNCEHIVIFADIRLTDRTCAQSASKYPICTGRSFTFVYKCSVCKHLATQWLVYDAGEILSRDPAAMCDVCLRHLLYTKDGKKIHPNFRVQKYIGHELAR